jgi:hypothetical protein
MLHTLSMTEYVNVKLPDIFRKQFENLNKEYDLGYSSFAEFIKDSLRRRFEEIMKFSNDLESS